MHVLLVEDDPGVQALLVEIVKRDGWTIECASDGVAAVRLLRTKNYAVVLLDLMLPKMNGFEVLQEMQACLPDLLKRTIVITAASERTLRDFDDRMVFMLIRKPFELAQLRRAVGDCADAASATAARFPARQVAT